MTDYGLVSQKFSFSVLAGVAHLVGHCPSSCWLDSLSEYMPKLWTRFEKQPINVPLPLFLPLFSFLLKKFFFSLAGMAKWIECWLVNQRVAGSIPSQGTCLGRRPSQVPSGGHVGAATH